MEMWLKQLTLVMCAAAVADMVILNETQEKVDVPYGSSLVLMCNLSIPKHDRSRVSWHFNPSGPSFSASWNLEDKIIIHSKETYSISLYNVTHNNSGWYFCKVTVEIPFYGCYNSSGTHINVTSENIMENTTYPSLVTSKEAIWPPSNWVIEWWMWIILGVSAFILIVLLVICILLRMRCHKSKEPEPIYINTRPVVNKQSSPRPSGSADNLKTAPAAQNLRTPSPSRTYEEGKRRQRHLKLLAQEY